jgi:hypothetical protein
MPLPGKKGKLFLIKRRKVRNHPFSTTAPSQLLRKSGFFRTAGKHHVNIETGGGGSTEIQYNLWNRFPTNPHSDGSESMPTDGDASKSTALTATNEHTLPLFLSDYPGNDKSQPINVRLTQRKPYRSPVTTSNRFNVIEVPIDYKQNTHSSTMLKNQSRSREFVPNIVLTNVMSLLPKIDEIRVFTETHSIDLFFISETWLKSNVGDDQPILPGYNLERLDRRIGIHVCFPIRNIKHPVYITWSVRIWKLCGFM